MGRLWLLRRLYFFFFLKSIPPLSSNQTALLLVAPLLGNQYEGRALGVHYANEKCRQVPQSGVINVTAAPPVAAGSITTHKACFDGCQINCHYT